MINNGTEIINGGGLYGGVGFKVCWQTLKLFILSIKNYLTAHMSYHNMISSTTFHLLGFILSNTILNITWKLLHQRGRSHILALSTSSREVNSLAMLSLIAGVLQCIQFHLGTAKQINITRTSTFTAFIKKIYHWRIYWTHMYNTLQYQAWQIKQGANFMYGKE